MEWKFKGHIESNVEQKYDDLEVELTAVQKVPRGLPGCPAGNR